MALAVYADAAPSQQVTGIRALLNQAEAYASSIPTEDLETLNEIAAGKFQTALENARRLLSDPEADQDALKQGWIDLSEAIHLLGFHSDKTGLQALYDLAVSLQTEHGSASAAEQLENAIAFAKSVLDDPAALNEISIAQAYQALEAAIAQFEGESLYDLDTLNFLIEQSQSVSSDLYLEKDFARFQEALAAAVAVSKNPESQQQIHEAASSLHSAYLNLHLAPSEELLKELTDFAGTLSSLDASVYSSPLSSRIQSYLNRFNTVFEAGDLDLNTAEQFKAEKDELITALNQEKPVSSLQSPQPSETHVVSPSVKPGQGIQTGSTQLSPHSAASVKTGSAASPSLYSLLAGTAAALIALGIHRRC